MKKYIDRYKTDPDFKARVTIYGGTLVNVIFALFKLISGIAVRSYWFGAIAIYYLMLSLVKLVLVRRDRARLKGDRGGDYEWRSYRVAGLRYHTDERHFRRHGVGGGHRPGGDNDYQGVQKYRVKTTAQSYARLSRFALYISDSKALSNVQIKQRRLI